jgi:hypothetical protein
MELHHSPPGTTRFSPIRVQVSHHKHSKTNLPPLQQFLPVAGKCHVCSTLSVNALYSESQKMDEVQTACYNNESPQPGLSLHLVFVAVFWTLNQTIDSTSSTKDRIIASSHQHPFRKQDSKKGSQEFKRSKENRALGRAATAAGKRALSA